MRNGYASAQQRIERTLSTLNGKLLIVQTPNHADKARVEGCVLHNDSPPPPQWIITSEWAVHLDSVLLLNTDGKNISGVLNVEDMFKMATLPINNVGMGTGSYGS